MKFIVKNLIIGFIVLNSISFIATLKSHVGNSNHANTNSEAASLNMLSSTNSLKALTSNKALMESYIKMNNLMKAHTASKYKSERGQLDFMAAFSELGLSHNSKRSASNKRIINERPNLKKSVSESINQYSFKAKEVENELESLKNKENTEAQTEAQSESQTEQAKTTATTSKTTTTGADGAAGAAGAALGNSKGPLENWWMIQSNELLSNSKYPPLKLYNETSVVIKIGMQGFRYNEAANCTAGKPKTPYLFYFRLNDEGLFYASTKTDVNVLGYINWDIIDDVVDTHEFFNKTSSHCMHLNDRDNKNWKICTSELNVFKEWFCRIKKMLKLEEPLCTDPRYTNPKGNLKGSQVITKVQPEVVIPLPSRDCNEFWSYKTNGKDWECICEEGFEQSPIDLPHYTAAIDSPIKPLFEYREVGPQAQYSTIDEMMLRGQNLEMKNEDGYISIIHDNLGKVITLDGAVYKAEEITFHTPSNHRIEGKSFPLEINVIHYGITKGDIAKQVVLSFLFEKKAGIYNKFVDDLDIFNIPNPITKTTKLNSSIFIPKILYNSGLDDDELVTFKPFSFYTYQGSLPFPPCTERTINYVTSKPLQIGSTIIQLFQEALRVPDVIKKTGDTMNVIVSNNLPISNREIQPLNGRPIFHFDHTKTCFTQPEKGIKLKTHGHYEKMKRSVEQIFYVTTTKPSGIPGAFVVPNEEVEGK